jgi:hypothetical protein
MRQAVPNTDPDDSDMRHHTSHVDLGSILSPVWIAVLELLTWIDLGWDIDTILRFSLGSVPRYVWESEEDGLHNASLK